MTAEWSPCVPTAHVVVRSYQKFGKHWSRGSRLENTALLDRELKLSIRFVRLLLPSPYSYEMQGEYI
jgi:hypothetical protein